MEILGIIAVLAMLGLAIALFILTLAGNWKVYVKMGEAGWKCLIPVYGTYVRFKRIWETKAAVIMLVANLIAAFTYLAEGIFMVVGIMRGNYEMNIATSMIIGWVVIIAAGISLSLYVIVANKQAEAFGGSVGTALGLILLPFIFIPMLGFGNAQYREKATKDEVEALPAPEMDAFESEETTS